MNDQTKINLTWFKESEDYHNHFYFTESTNQKSKMERFLEELDMNGDVWTPEGKHFPLICSKIMRDHSNVFMNTLPDGSVQNKNFVFRTFVDNNASYIPTKDDLSRTLDMLDNRAMAMLYLNHDNKHLRIWGENIVKGKWDDIDFTIDEITPGEIDRLIPEEEAK